ncbi:hypothetical protein BU24DRAFT_495441 [Aaosphaeria arxii CBS 175.79]|uniref:NACHT domain-containing protein n=1 Tax=Aaosphaeria arxii CBS 175.79 TaxID=1450172 RepID=A0A6A5XEF9_9PLEO|nr:uncharacterized protein BU24DRAFT_495441 [Aaosphaeria arxii CBS 175.79]KAF2011216.1 hypothetical protein BU24DRAFT_495441 [Aaosphaeria arxii CBS 175.79]
MNPVTINHAGGDINIGTQNNDLNGNSSPALSFFKTSEYESYKNINPKREPQTCRWFLEHPTFQAWKARDKGGLLWLTADPGCGKSVLSRALIDERLVGVGTSKICFFFFKDNNDQSSIATTLCALLHQLLRARKSEGLFSKYCVPAIGECADDLKTDFEELWKVFKKIALDPSVGDIIIVLDALDECPTTSRNILIDRIGELYDDAQEECRLKFLVTSRPYHEIKVKFNPLLRKLFTIRLDGDAESDSICQEIDTVIRTKVANIAQNLDLGNDLAMTLLRKLRETQNRTYLWVHLILEGFEESFAFTHQKIEKFISTLPGSVEAAYERILDRCRNRADARKILHIVIAAQRPLTLEEFDIALEINTDLEAPTTDIRHLNCLGNDHRLAMIRNTCGLFVTVTYNRVSLIHQTAYEFLIQKEASPSVN